MKVMLLSVYEPSEYDTDIQLSTVAEAGEGIVVLAGDVEAVRAVAGHLCREVALVSVDALSAAFSAGFDAGRVYETVGLETASRPDADDFCLERYEAWERRRNAE